MNTTAAQPGHWSSILEKNMEEPVSEILLPGWKDRADIKKWEIFHSKLIVMRFEDDLFSFVTRNPVPELNL